MRIDFVDGNLEREEQQNEVQRQNETAAEIMLLIG